MKCLITGGAGFIGSNLVDRLLELGHEVEVIDNFSTGKEENLAQHKRLKVHRRNICGFTDDIFENSGIDVVFHLAAIPRVQYSIKDPEMTMYVNVDGTKSLLKQCRNNGIKRFVFSSSSSIYGDQETLPFKEDMPPNPMSPYASQKLIGEIHCNMFNLLYRVNAISLRYFNVYGPRMNPEGDYACLIPRSLGLIMKDKSPEIRGDGNQTRDFTYVSDVVEANILAAEAGKECFGQVFNIGSGKGFSVNEIVKRLLKLSGKKIKPVHAPEVIEPRNTLADISKAQKLLKWQPKVSLEDGLKETFDCLSRI